jgi:hypothetical protein
MNESTKTAGSFALLILMLLGIAGLIYSSIGADGWVARLFSNIMTHSLAGAIAIVLGLAAAIWLGKGLLKASQRHNIVNDGLVYLFVGLGLYFVGRLLLTGSI